MARQNVIQYITIASAGNAQDFGDLSTTSGRVAACASPTRGVFGHVANASASTVMEYITIGSTGNTTDFGDLTSSRRSGVGFSY